MEEIIQLALLLLTIFYYVYKALKKQPEDVLPVPGLPEEVRKGSRKPRSESQDSGIQEVALPHELPSTGHPAESKKPLPVTQATQAAFNDENEPSAVLTFLEENYSAEQKLVIYSEIMKRPES